MKTPSYTHILTLHKTVSRSVRRILTACNPFSDILYTTEVYANTSPTYLDKLSKLNNKLLRILQNKRSLTNSCSRLILWTSYAILLNLLHEQAGSYMRSIMRPILSDVHGLSVSLSLVTRMYCGKTAKPIKMPFGLWGGVGDSHHVLDGGSDPPTGRGKFGVKRGPSHSKV